MPPPKAGIPHSILLLVCGMAVVSNLAANALQGVLDDRIPSLQSTAGNLLAAAILLVLFYLLSIVLWRKRGTFFPVHVLREGGRPDPKECLVMFLSKQTPPLFRADRTEPCVITGEGGSMTLGCRLADDLAALAGIGRGWNWAQMLRALEPHQESLRRLHLVSSQTSAPAAPDAAALIKCYLPQVKVIPFPDAIDFEKVGEVLRVLRQILHQEKRAGHRTDHMSIDITGGQKIVSIAGASMTLVDENLVFQYVGTNPPFAVKEYDLVPCSPTEG
jgi:hypothetical protein